MAKRTPDLDVGEQSVAGVTSLAVTLPSAPAGGSMMLLIATSSGNYPEAPDSSWVLIFSKANSGVVRAWAKLAGPGEPLTVVVTQPTAERMTVRLLTYASLGAFRATSDPGGSNTSNTFTLPAITPVAGEEIIDLAAFVFFTSPVPIAWNATGGLTKTGADQAATGSGGKSGLSLASVTAPSTAPITGPGGTFTDASDTEVYSGQLAFSVASVVLTVNVGEDDTIFTSEDGVAHAVVTGGSGTRGFVWSKVSGPAGSFADPSIQNTTFDPSGGVGDYVLRLTVTDTSGSAHDDFTLHVVAAPQFVEYATIDTSTGWTPTSGTILEVLTDSSTSSYAYTSDDPDHLVVGGYIAPMQRPSEDFHVVARARRAIGTAASTLTARLYNDATLVSTSSVEVLSSDWADHDISFPAVDVATIPMSVWDTPVAPGRSNIRVTFDGDVS